MRQQTLAVAADGSFEKYRKPTRREIFLGEMDRIVPWAQLVALVEPQYPKAGNGRRPVGVERMLRIYFLQQWFNLSDPAVEESLYEAASMRQFVGIDLHPTDEDLSVGTPDLGQEPVPDGTTICRFRHLLEKHELGGRMLDTVNYHLGERGIKIATGIRRGGWTRPSCMRHRRQKTKRGSAIRRCTRRKKETNGTSA